MGSTFKKLFFWKAKAALFFVVLMLWGSFRLFAAGGPFGGTFDPGLGISIKIFQEGSSVAVPKMDFGTLVQYTDPSSGKKTLRSAVGYLVMIYPQPTGYIYQLTCTGGPLTSANGSTIPAGACTVVPSYSASDNNFGAGPTPMPSDASLGTKGPWVTATPRILYSSGWNGEYRAVQAHFAITDDPAAGATSAVPLTQQSGTYNSTVTITITE